MQDIVYRGEKALLITSDDLDETDVRSGARMEEKLSRLRQEGYRWIFVMTSRPVIALPKRLRDLITGEQRHCFAGQIK